NIVLVDQQIGGVSDIDGLFRIEEIPPGVYDVSCSFIGFESVYLQGIRINTSKPTSLEIKMFESTTTLEEVNLSTNPFTRSKESPVSLKNINASEIYRNPGGNRDISKVIQILPGVGSSASFRNDIIVRGGAPNENRFFLDGIEVPNINHFATQGSSGGPVGMLNVNFIQSLDFYSGAFPVNRGNALSSVMDFSLIEGNNEGLNGNFMLGSSDIGLTLEGPIGEKSTFIFSVRRSYLQFLFKALKLPFLPTYNDSQFKQTVKINQKNKLTIIGLGAIDDFSLNKEVNANETDSAVIVKNNYTLGYLPINTQWNYTLGANWTHYSENSFQNIIVSRNHLNNNAVKYLNNIETPQNLLLDYNSQEIENKLRLENTYISKSFKLKSGIGVQAVTYTNSTLTSKVFNGTVSQFDFNSELSFLKYSLFSQISSSVLKQRLDLSFGLRTDFANYSKEMANPLDQLSPRLSGSYALTEKLKLNFNTGIYYQQPAYTVLGYRDSSNQLANKENGVTYIQSKQVVFGLEYQPTKFSKISMEAFAKSYNNYPFLLGDSISLANLGGDFGVIGNEPVSSISKGRSYGLELFVQQKLSSTIYGIFSYTFVRSEFLDKNDAWTPSSWDNVHILNLTAGKKFKNNWELGMKFRLLGGAPYTPFDRTATAIKENWDVTQRGIFDWDNLNQERNALSHGLDVRIDKKWFFKEWDLNLYLDVQNVYNFTSEGPVFLDVQRNSNNQPITDPANTGRYLLQEIDNTQGTLLPSVGIMIGF
ncbi:MAG: hypothetical protein ACI8ZO_000489, partial [Flavobacteriales bacterium]